MANDFIHVEQGKNEDIFDLIGRMPDRALAMLRETLDDISDEIEKDANRRIPEGPTGDLKAAGIDRKDLRRRVKGPGGLVVKHELSVPKVPKYAKFVHDGTGVYGPKGVPYGPRKAPFMIFFWQGKWHKRKTVAGQEPQPFLRDAVEQAQQTIIPIKLAELRAKLETLT